jgi:hypothetical protein
MERIHYYDHAIFIFASVVDWPIYCAFSLSTLAPRSLLQEWYEPLGLSRFVVSRCRFRVLLSRGGLLLTSTGQRMFDVHFRIAKPTATV